MDVLAVAFTGKIMLNTCKPKEELLISVIIPCYNEEEVLYEMMSRLDSTKNNIQTTFKLENSIFQEKKNRR